MINVEISQAQLREILQKTHPAIVREPLADFMKTASVKGMMVAKHNISGGLQMAKISIRTDVEPLSARVYSVMPQERALSIEEGRRPGDAPSLLQAARWVHGRRHLTRRRMAELTRDELATAVGVVQSIQQSGARGKHYLMGAKKSIQRDLPRLLGEIVQKIEGRFGR